MKKLLNLFVVVIALGSAAGLRADGPYLRGFDPISLLLPPPALHSAEDQADRDSAYEVLKARTSEDEARGRAESKVTIAAFEPVLPAGFEPRKYPLLGAMLKDLEAEAKAAIDESKYRWKRPRVYTVEPDRFNIHIAREKSPGYPSGHSTRGTLLAVVLAELFPDRREAIFGRGRLIGWTRVEIGDHTPLEVYMGRVLGQAMGRQLLANPDFQADLSAVKAEIAAPLIP